MIGSNYTNGSALRPPAENPPRAWENPDDYGAWDSVRREALTGWVRDVRVRWETHWRGKDHRYGHDFYAFLGEALMTDFGIDRRPIERGPL